MSCNICSNIREEDTICLACGDVREKLNALCEKEVVNVQIDLNSGLNIWIKGSLHHKCAAEGNDFIVHNSEIWPQGCFNVLHVKCIGVRSGIIHVQLKEYTPKEQLTGLARFTWYYLKLAITVITLTLMILLPINIYRGNLSSFFEIAWIDFINFVIASIGWGITITKAIWWALAEPKE